MTPSFGAVMRPDAKPLIITAVTVSGIIAVVPTIAAGKWPSVRVGVGAAFVAVVLLAMAEVEPEWAKGFALLLLVSSVFVKGGPAFQAVSHSVKGN